MEFLSRNRLFQTTDLDEGMQFVGQIWERHKSALTEGSYGLRWNQVDLDRTSFSYVEHDCSVDLQAQGPLSDHFRIFLHQEGSIRHELNGRPVVSDASNAIVHAPGIDCWGEIRPFKFLLASLSGDLVRSALVPRHSDCDSLAVSG